MSQFKYNDLIKIKTIFNNYPKLEIKNEIQLHGFLTAIFISPELIKPNEWLSYIFNDDLEWQSEAEFNLFFQTCFRLCNEIPLQIQAYELESFYPNRKCPDEKSWAEGFCYGALKWLCDKEDNSEELELLAIIGIYTFDEETSDVDKDKLKMVFGAGSFGCNSFFDLVDSFIEFIDPVHLDEDFIRDDHAPGFDRGPQKLAPIKNTESLPGRNELCPCGSGKKFKKCCASNS